MILTAAAGNSLMEPPRPSQTRNKQNCQRKQESAMFGSFCKFLEAILQFVCLFWAHYVSDWMIKT